MSGAVAGPPRRARVSRSTRETRIQVELSLDGFPPGDGTPSLVSSGLPFVDHLLGSMARHGRMGLRLKAQGDLDAGAHHTVEDSGLTLGEAIRIALYGPDPVAPGSSARGVARFGHAVVPMDDALVLTAIDLSGRTRCALSGFLEAPPAEAFQPALWVAFCRALASGAMINLHQRVICGEDGHHILEAAAKSLGLALMAAWRSLDTGGGPREENGRPPVNEWEARPSDQGSLKGPVRLEAK